MGKGTVLALALGLVSALGGCTALLDTSKVQCNTHQECADLFPGSPYLCVDHVCERPFCNADADCRSQSDLFSQAICNVETHQCAPPECTETADCGNNSTCNKDTNRCVPRECNLTADCLTATRESPTIMCIEGFCKDPTWDCIGKPDNRERTSETGTLEFRLISWATEDPVPGAVWDIKVCGGAQYDRTVPCDPEWRPKGTSWEYDAATGLVRIHGLNPDLPVRIWIDETALKDTTNLAPKTPEGGPGPAIIPMEFITQKPPVNVTRAPDIRIIAWDGLISLIESYGNTEGSGELLRRDRASLYGVVYDCQDKPAANVTPSYTYLLDGSPVQEHLIFYFNEAGLAFQGFTNPLTNSPPSKEWTFGTGIFSTMSMPAAQNLSIQTSLVVDDRTKRSRLIRKDFSARLTLGRVTTVHFYPRDYGAKAK